MVLSAGALPMGRRSTSLVSTRSTGMVPIMFPEFHWRDNP